MNTQLQYLNNLYSQRLIDKQTYLTRIDLAYKSNPRDFSEEDVDFIEKRMKANDIDFSRDMASSENSVRDVLNQFTSGVVEGFTTLGWASEADTQTEALANKVGHFIGFAPDIIASVLSMGAAVPGVVAKRGGAKLAVKRAVGRPTKEAATKRSKIADQIVAAEAAEESIKQSASGLAASMGQGAAKIEIGGFRPFAKFIAEEGQEEAVKLALKAGEKEIKDLKGWQIRSIPMRVADMVTDNIEKKIASSGLLSQGFLSKGLFKNETFQQLAREGVHLGIALGASSVWKGPKAIAESTMHGALAGVTFGGIGRYVNISKLLSNPKTRKLGEQAVRDAADNSLTNETAANAFARGIAGASFQGGMATYNQLPLPEQVYEYMMGFFFGANSKSPQEIKFRKMIAENPMANGNSNINRYKKDIQKTEIYKENPEVQEMFDKHVNTLYLQQQQRAQKIGAKLIIDREIVKIAEEKKIDIEKATPEQLKELSEEATKSDAVQALMDRGKTPVELYIKRFETDKDFARKTQERQQAVEKFQIEEVKKRLLDSFDPELNAYMKSKDGDINDPIAINTALDKVYQQILKEPSNYNLGKYDTKQLLIEGVYENINDYAGFESYVQSKFKGVKFTNEVGEVPLKSMFLRIKTYAERSQFAINASGEIVEIGTGKDSKGKPKLEVDKDGKNLVERTAENSINERYGLDTRVIIRKAEDPKNPGTYKEPLDIYSKAELDKLYENLLVEYSDYYIYGGAKDKGTVILQRVPNNVKENLNTYVEAMLESGVSKEYLKSATEQLEMASNMVYKLLDNGYIERPTVNKADLKKALKELKQDIAEGKINGDVLKDNKYDTLPQSDVVPMDATDLAKVMDGGIYGYLNLVGVTDKKLKKYGIELESGTDGGFIIREDVWNSIGNKFGWAKDYGFLKPVIVANPRMGRGEIRTKSGGFKPESAGLNKLMMDTNTHILVYGSGIKQLGKLKLNELIEGKNDTWSFKDALDVAKIRPEELGINESVTDYVYKQRIEINRQKKLKLYKQFLDKNTLQDFDQTYFDAIQELRIKNMEGNEKLTQEFLKGGDDYINFDIDTIRVQDLIDTLQANPTTKRSKEIVNQLNKQVNKDTVDLSDVATLDMAEIAELGFTPEVLKKTDYAFNVMKENQNFISNILARYIIGRSNQIGVESGFKAYAGLYTPRLERMHGLKETEFMLGEQHRKNPVKVGQEVMTLEKAYEQYKELKKTKADKLKLDLLEDALTFLVMRTPNSGNGGVRALVFKGFVERGGYNFFASELNDLYLGGMDKDGDTVTGYQSLPPIVKKAFSNPKIQYELQDGNISATPRDLKRMTNKYDKQGRSIAETLFDVVFGEKSGPTYTYSKTEGFEVSTKGDNFGKQFSALNARLKDGRTIEEAYQQAKGTGKGQPAKDPNFDYYGTYKSLWQQWAKENPGKIKELKDYLDKNNITTLRDRFATTENRQDRALAEILNEQTVGKKTKDDSFSKLFSTKERIKAAKAAYEGNKAIGTIVNATTDFQMLFDIITTNGGRLDIGNGYTLKIKLNDFGFLKDVSYTGINIAVDSAEFVRIGSARDNVQKIFETFFTVQRNGKDVSTQKSSKWYTLTNNKQTSLHAFKVFSKAIQSKKDVWVNPEHRYTGKGKYRKIKNPSLIKAAKDFIDQWQPYMKQGAETNYFMQQAQLLSKLDMGGEFLNFKFTSPENVVAYLQRTYQNLKKSSTFKELELLDFYKDLNVKFLTNDLKGGKNLRGTVNNLIGVDLLTRKGDYIIELLSKQGMARENIIQDLQTILRKTFEMKQGENSRAIAESILDMKKVMNTMLTKRIKNPQALNIVRREMYAFMDFALHAHPIVKTKGNPKLGNAIYNNKLKKNVEYTLNQGYDRIQEIYKELENKFPDESTMKYDADTNAKLSEVRNIKNAIEGLQNQLMFKNPAIDPANSKVFFNTIDAVYNKTNEIKAPETTENADIPVSKTRTVKAKDLEKGVREEIAKEKQEKEIKVIEEQYAKIKVDKEGIAKIDFEQAYKDPNLTDYGKAVLRRLENFLKTHKGFGSTIDAQFESFTTGRPFQGFQLGKEFSDATAKDINNFMNYYDSMLQPGIVKRLLQRSIKFDKETGTYSIEGAPKWFEHFATTTLKDQLKFIENAEKDQTLGRVTNIVKDKDGNIKYKVGTMPFSTIELNTELTLAFHQMNNAKQKDIEEQIEKSLRLIRPEDRAQGNNFTTLFKFTMIKREANPAKDGTLKFYDGIKNREQEINIENKYKTLKAEFDKMTKEGVKFKFETETGVKGERINKTPEQVVEMINESYTNIMTTVANDVILSNVSTLRDKLVRVGKKINEYKITDEEILTEPKPNEKGYVDKKIAYDLQQKKMTFLDANGLLSNQTKVDALYAGLSELIASNPLGALRQLPSITDVNFFRYYQRLNEHLERVFEKEVNIKGKKVKLDFTKQLSKEEYAVVRKVKEDYMRNKPLTKIISIGRYLASDGTSKYYVPHTDAFGTKFRREQNEAAIEKIIAKELEKAKKDPKILSSIDLEFAASNRDEIALKKALLRYEISLKEKYEGYNTRGVDKMNDIAELAIIEDFTLQKPMDSARYNGHLKGRSEEVSLPEWDLGINHVDRYVGSMYRNLINSNLSLKVGNNIKRFVNKNPLRTDKDITESWAYFMMDVAKNQMGYPSIRNFDIHGITQKEFDLLKDYAKNDFDKSFVKGMRKQKDFLERVDYHIGLDTLQRGSVRAEIEAMKRNNVDPDTRLERAQAMAKELRMENLAKLLQEKNINKIGRFGNGYGLMTDESVIEFTERLDKVFGGKILDAAPKNRAARDMYIARLGQNLNDLEGKFEMMSLLFHPKTFITNIYGGGSNTITDVGLKPFTDALSDTWWNDNVWGEKTTYKILDSATGEIVTKTIRNRKDWEEWQAYIGTFEDMLINEAQKDSRFQMVGMSEPLVKAVKTVSRTLSKDGLRAKNDKEFDNFADMTTREVFKEVGAGKAITNAGAVFMRKSEFLLRSRTWDAAYINARQMLGEFGKNLPFDHPMLIQLANRTVKASQFIYHATQRPNVANTSLGRVMTRFHPYAWNSIGRRIKIYRGARFEEWSGGYKTQRAQRQLTADLMALSLANIFVASIFDYALSPPMNWMQDTAMLLFGDEEERERAFFSQYPHPVLSPLSIVTPPIARFVLAPTTALLNQDFENLTKYQLATYFPFGRFGRDVARTYKSPAMFGEFMFGIPVHTLHDLRRDQIEANEEEIEEDLD